MSETLKSADELGKRVIDALPGVVDGMKDFSVNTADKILAFVEKETPNLLGEIVAMGQCAAIAEIVGCIVMLITGISILVWTYKLTKHRDFATSEGRQVIFALSCLFTVVILLVTITNVSVQYMNWIKPFAAPRIYVLEYLRDLVK